MFCFIFFMEAEWQLKFTVHYYDSISGGLCKDDEASSGKLRHGAISILMNFNTVLILKLNTCLILPLRCVFALSQWEFQNFFPSGFYLLLVLFVFTTHVLVIFIWLLRVRLCEKNKRLGLWPETGPFVCYITCKIFVKHVKKNVVGLFFSWTEYIRIWQF